MIKPSTNTPLKIESLKPKDGNFTVFHDEEGNKAGIILDAATGAMQIKSLVIGGKEIISKDGRWNGDLTGLKGKDGKDGRDGFDGKDGRDGDPGKDGKDGKNGSDGRDGAVNLVKYGSFAGGKTWYLKCRDLAHSIPMKETGKMAIKVDSLVMGNLKLTSKSKVNGHFSVRSEIELPSIPSNSTFGATVSFADGNLGFSETRMKVQQGVGKKIIINVGGKTYSSSQVSVCVQFSYLEQP